MTARTRRAASLGALALLLAPGLAGCSYFDPYQRPGAWRPSAANETNLRLQIADPRDLQQGVEERGSDGQLTAAAVQRLRENTGARPFTTIGTGASAGGSN